MAPKRTSSAGKAASPKRAPKRAKTVAPEAPILDFLGKCDEIPKPCREMLQASVPICLEVVEAERHKFQVEVLERVAALMATVESKKREVIKVAETELKEIEAEKDAAAATAEAKKAASGGKKSECDEKGLVVDAAREVSNAAQKTLSEAQGAEAEFNKKKDGLTAEQDNFAKLLADVFQPMKDGTFQGKGFQKTKSMGELKKKLVELGCQESLGDALVATLKMTPEKREGSFAKVTIQFVEEAFNKHTAKVAQDIAGLGTEAAGHTSAIAAAEATLAEKKAALEVVSKEWDAMQDIWVAMDGESNQAAKELKSIEARIPKVTKSIDKAQADLDKFLEVPALFAKLKEHSTAVPEEPEAAEEETKDAEEPAGEEAQAEA